MDLAASLKIEFGDGKRLGPGKVRLLELIAEKGSIAAAARELGMSYRRAWLLISELNGMFGAELVAKAAGGAGGGGAEITELGREVAEAYREIEAETSGLIERKLRKLVRR